MVHILDVILGLVIVEALALALYNRQTGRGIRPRAFAANMAAGFCLMAVARMALAAAPDRTILILLFVALCAHLADLASRWTKRG